MERLSPELAGRLRDARRVKGLSQHALAREAGCTQSAVSMMELGRPDAVSRETLRKIGALLDIEVGEPDAARPSEGAFTATGGRVCCPQAECPSNVPFAVAGSVVFLPGPQPAGRAGGYCGFCGEVLLTACPVCARPLGAGGHCRDCGAAYVNPPAAPGLTPDAWVAERRKQIGEWRALL
jgi:DNA-binding Xre family transcriptional regulator